MSDVSELVGRCQEHLTMSKFLRKDHLLDRANEDRALAADALETLAGEVKDLETELEYVKKQREDYFSEYRKKLTEYTEMKIALAKLAPVVDAAVYWYSGSALSEKNADDLSDAVKAYLSTLEAAMTDSFSGYAYFSPISVRSSTVPFTPDGIHAAEIEAAREEGRRAGIMEAAQVAWKFNVCDPWASKIAAAIEAKAKEGR